MRRVAASVAGQGVTHALPTASAEHVAPALAARPLTADAFARYGRVLESDREGFSPVFAPDGGGPWLVGINNVVDAEIASIHYHPNTWECFAPVGGPLYLAVAPAGWDPSSRATGAHEAIEVFHVTSPVCIAPYVWHVLVAPSRCTAFICENAAVTGHRVTIEPALRVEFGPT